MICHHGWCSITWKWQYLVLKPLLHLRNDRKETLGRRSNFRTAFLQMNTIWQIACHAMAHASQRCEETIHLETSPNSDPDFPQCSSPSRNKVDAQRSLLTLWRQQAFLSNAVWKSSSPKWFVYMLLYALWLTQGRVDQLVDPQIKSTDIKQLNRPSRERPPGF